MKGRTRRYLLVAGVAMSIIVGIVAAPSCYSPKLPQCGFICGPNNSCPEDYTCAADHRCHLNGSPGDLVCASPDAAIDAPPDMAVDAPVDAEIDAPADAEPDAAADAEPDAP